jgi:hypothetical protein
MRRRSELRSCCFSSVSFCFRAELLLQEMRTSIKKRMFRYLSNNSLLYRPTACLLGYIATVCVVVPLVIISKNNKITIFRNSKATSRKVGEGTTPGTCKRYFPSSRRPDRYWALSNLFSAVSGALYRGEKRAGLEAGYSPSFNVEVTNASNDITIPHMTSWMVLI